MNKNAKELIFNANKDRGFYFELRNTVKEKSVQNVS